MTTVYFGDSLTSGENVGFYSYVDYIRKNAFIDEHVKYGISGTTMGEYSIYPTDGHSLLSELYSKTAIIKRADKIFLEYGLNDVSAIMCDFTTLNDVMISFVKCIDFIKQTNPKVEIIFLALSRDKRVVQKNAELMCQYLQEDYFGGFDFFFPPSLYTDIYCNLIECINKNKKVKVLPMINDKDFYEKYLDVDKIHPNIDGYNVIGEVVKRYI